MKELADLIKTGEALRDAIIAKNGGLTDQHLAKFFSGIVHTFGHDKAFMDKMLPQANELHDLVVARKFPGALGVLLAFLVLFRAANKHAGSTVEEDRSDDAMTSAEEIQAKGSGVAACSPSDLETTSIEEQEEAWNLGEETIEWLYSEQLKIDSEWSDQTSLGFTWWADKHAQTIEVVETVTGPEGEPGCLIAVRTELLRDLVLDEKSLAGINAVLMSFASMAGPVYDEDEQTLSLCTLVSVHDDIKEYMKRMLSVAAAVQIGMTGAFATALANSLKCQTAVSGHPRNGIRPEPDDICNLMAFFAQEGKGSCKWPRKEFRDAVDKHMQQLPAMRGKAGKLGFTVEFPYGKRESSMFEAAGDQPHSVLGNGLFTLQSFPLSGTSDVEGVKLALSLNAEELTEKPTGYGFGSYAFRDGAIHFVNFFPNVTHKAGMLTDLFCASALRAREMSVRLTGSDWTDWTGNPSGPKRSAMGRIKDLLVK